MQPIVVSFAQIENITKNIVPFIIPQEEGFAAYSRGEVTVPPVGHLSVPETDGEVHIKYGMIKVDAVFVVKIATGFYRNPARNLPSSGGLFLVFDAVTGATKAILLENGLLTDLRTAIAGHISAKYLGPSRISRVAVLGTGSQSRLQLHLLETLTPCREVAAWGRDKERARALARDLEPRGWNVTVCDTAEQAIESSNLVVTTTSSKYPLFRGDALQRGTHITAMGYDGGRKRELD